MTLNSTGNQAKKFLGVGTATVVIDYIIYIVLISSFGFNEWFKALSFAAGALFSFLCNSYFTFSQPRLHFRQLVKFAFTYYLSMNINVFVNALGLKIIPLPIAWSMTAAFLLATFASSVVNFGMMKFFVYE